MKIEHEEVFHEQDVVPVRIFFGHIPIIITYTIGIYLCILGVASMWVGGSIPTPLFSFSLGLCWFAIGFYTYSEAGCREKVRRIRNSRYYDLQDNIFRPVPHNLIFINKIVVSYTLAGFNFLLGMFSSYFGFMDMTAVFSGLAGFFWIIAAFIRFLNMGTFSNNFSNDNRHLGKR